MLVNSILSILILLLSPLIVLSNTLIISVWLRFKRLRTPSNALIISLAIADLGFGLFLPAAVALEIADPNSTCDTLSIMCVIPFAVLLTFSAASLLSITLIALDRFTSVSQPLRYNHFVTMSNIHRFLFLSWGYAILLGVAVISIFSFTPPFWFLSWIVIFLYLPCLLSVIISYGYIFVVARNHARAIYSVEVSLHNGATCEVTSTLGHSNRYGLTLAMILLSILISWLPILSLAFCDILITQMTQDEVKSINTQDFVEKTDSYRMILMNPQWRMVASLPLVVSCLTNPWLYGYRSSEMRVAVIRLLDWAVTKATGRPQNADIMYSYHKGDFTSCASNMRLVGASPTHTTVQCCSPSPTPNADRKHLSTIHLMICDNQQVSSL